eukprot:tig00001127_g7149.t1
MAADERDPESNEQGTTVTAVVDLEASPPQSGELEPPSSSAARAPAGLQRPLAVPLGRAVDVAIAPSFVHVPRAWFHNFAAVGAIVVALIASRWRRLPLCKHWFLFGVASSYMLYLAWLWPAGAWWDGPAHLVNDISDEVGPPIWFWGIGVAGASHWWNQLVVVLVMYGYFLPLKVNAAPDPFKLDVGVSNGISLGMSCLIAVATNYLREREVAQRPAPAGGRRRAARPRAGTGAGAGEGEAEAKETRGRRLLRRVTLAFPDPAEEEGFRLWSVRYARRRTLLYATALLTAFTVSSVILWNRSWRASMPGEAFKVLAVLLAGGVLPGALVLLSAIPRPLWDAFYARAWLHQWGMTVAAVAANGSCMALLGVLPGGRAGIPSREDRAIWWTLVLLSNSVPLCLVTLRVRFCFALGWLACWLAAFAAVFPLIDRGTRLLTTSVCFLALAMAATRDIERERRALWRESVAALAAPRPAEPLPGAHAHEP